MKELKENFKKSNSYYLNYVPAFVLFVIIFKFIYLDNGISTLFGIFVPILGGIFLAVVLNPMYKLIREKLINIKMIAILIVYSIFVGIIVMAGIIVIPRIVGSINQFIMDIPRMINALENLFEDPPERLQFIIEHQSYQFFLDNIQTLTQRISEMVSSLVDKTLVKLLDITSGIIDFIIAIFISGYILVDKNHFKNLASKTSYTFFNDDKAQEIIDLGYELNQNVTKFIFGKFIDSLIVGMIAYIVMNFIIQTPYPLILAIVIGITNMIPYFGPFIGGVPAAIIIFLLDPVKGLWMMLFVFLLQQFDGWVLGPKIIGIQLDLKPVWIITAILIGGGLFGLWGMFFATPIAALLKTIFNKYMDIKLKDKKIHLENENN
ncbi:MAG: AI-2E family transporter [Bacillota bacterium]|nr:AI-2E family transporter [Bacillota bacterium]